jgi:NAD(P)H-hydrate epimerase
VTVAVPDSLLPIVAAGEPSYLTAPFPEDAEGRFSEMSPDRMLRLAENASAIACGPGCGQSEGVRQLVHTLYTTAARPLVVDADGLNALAAIPLDHRPVRGTAPRILTPHPGEFARLLGCDTATVQRDREALAARYAREQGVVVLLKGQATIITDGKQVAINTTGNSGMATGGTGDVLTGLLAALLAQQMPPFEAAQLAAHLHGLAGDLAAADLTSPGLIASDLPDYLCLAWKQMGAATH